MDARDRLRRYLEQRRELGESEFVLDGMPVDDVLRLVGARTAQRSRDGAPVDRAPRATGGAPVAPASGAANDVPEPTPSERPLPPPEPERRFASSASTDWREALRNAGAGKPGSEAGAARPSEPASARPATAAGAPTSAAGGASAGAPSTPASSSATAALPAWLAALDVPAGLEAARLRVADLSPEVAQLPGLEEIAAKVSACTACALHKSAKHPVPGEGHPRAELLCVGEAPGANEDEQGRPFVGEAGQLLTKILGAIQLSRDEVYICNVLKHRPPGNRDPLPDEVLACQPFLLRQIEVVRPRVILALGRFAAQTLLQTNAAIGALRGRVHQYHGVPLIVTYHPAALLRNEAWKRPTWEDVKLARRVLDASRAAHSGTE